MNRTGLACAAALAGTVLASNALVTHVGLVTVAPGVLAPAAVLVVGVALVLRDVVHELAGWRTALAAVAVGSVLSLLISPEFALASAAAYFLGEAFDACVYAPLRRRGFTVAAVVSSLLGALLDSVVFLWLSPLPATLLTGQLIGKAYGVAVAVLVARYLLQKRRTA